MTAADPETGSGNADFEVRRCIDEAPVRRREMLRLLHDLVLDSFPEARVYMQYRMPTYPIGEGWLAIANQKHYVSVYTCSSRHIEAFKANHPGIKSGKGCINFAESDPLPRADLKRVIQKAFLQPRDDAQPAPGLA